MTDAAASRDRAAAVASRRRQAWEAIDWRLVTMAALFALVGPLRDWIGTFREGDYSAAASIVLKREATAGFVLAFAALFIRAPSRLLPRPLALALGVVAGSLLAMALFPLDPDDYGEGFPGGTPTHWTLTWFFGRLLVLYWGILAAAWYFVDRAARRQAALHEAALARRQLESQLVEARLSMMQAQVEPHFLFNTLAHLKRLFKTDPALGREMLDRLCEYLQAALPQMRSAVATLDSELALAQAYLEVQRIRMGERLAFDIAAEPRDRQRAFPPMMLTSLVENAIKHGVNPLPEGGTVHVIAQSTDQTLRVIVADSGRGFSTLRGTGVGLANIRSRLAALYGEAARVTLAPNKPNGLRATIEIPLAEVPAARPSA